MALAGPLNGDLAKAAQIAAATTTRAIDRLMEAEKVVDAAEALLHSMRKDAQLSEYVAAIDGLTAALASYAQVRAS